MWKNYNPNPVGKSVGDCTVRALCAATGKSWQETYTALTVEGYRLCDMPSANHVWGAFLKSRGWHRKAIEDTCPECYTVEAFCKDHPKGRFVLALSGHVVCVDDGDWFDSWDSGDCVPLYYWEKKEE